jgi:hypothetical protein
VVMPHGVTPALAGNARRRFVRLQEQSQEFVRQHV